MDPVTVGGITLTVDALFGALGAAVGAGLVIGCLMVFATLFYGRWR